MSILEAYEMCSVKLELEKYANRECRGLLSYKLWTYCLHLQKMFGPLCFNVSFRVQKKALNSSGIIVKDCIIFFNILRCKVVTAMAAVRKPS
jgi:hypothetical protein